MCGGLSFLLSCNYNCGKLPLKLANFHKQALEAWTMAFKHNFSPHSCIIWNNQHILSRNKSIFKKDWFDRNIIFISDVLTDRGNPYTYDEFVQNKGINISRKVYNNVITSISPKLLFLIKNAVIYGSLNTEIPKLLIGGKDISGGRCNNLHIRKTLTSSQSCLPNSIFLWKLTFPNISTDKVWTDHHKFLLPNKIKEVHLKILHRYYPCNELLHKFKEDVSPLCSFCRAESESVSHLFYTCPFSREFWIEAALMIFSAFNTLTPISEEMVLFLNCTTELQHINCAVQAICLTGKFHIHKARITQSKPNINLFRIDLQYLFASVSKIIKNKKAYKTSQLIGKILCIE